MFAANFTITNNVLQPVSGATQISSTFDLTNQGTGVAANNFRVTWRLSTDQLQSADDLLLSETIFTDDFAPGQTQAQPSLIAVLPTEATPGNYYLIVCVDEDDTLDESNEVNNCVRQFVEIFEPTNDCNLSVAVTNLQCDDNGTPNIEGDDTFTADVTVTNPGGGTGFVPGSPLPCLIGAGDYGVTYSIGPSNILGWGK